MVMAMSLRGQTRTLWKTGALTAIMAVSFTLIAPPLYAAGDNPTVTGKVSIQKPTDPPVMKLVTERKRRNLNHIYAFDRSPLGERVPVILMPGRAEEFQHSSWWKRFRDITYKMKEFEDNFKLYAFIYDSADELDNQAQDFSQELKNHFGELPPERQVLLVSYSLGGVITRMSMDNPEVFNRVHSVIAIGVPFHGSPLFDPDWFTKYLRPQNHSPIRQLWDRVIYRMYLMTKNNLTRGLKWNNFDGSMPQFAVDEEVRGDLVVSKSLPYVEESTTEPFKQKTLIYASYMDNAQTVEQPTSLDLPKIVGSSTKIPKEIIGALLPLYGSSVHAVFVYMNHQLANLPTFDPENAQGRNKHVYKYNDGVIPLSSALYLPPRDKPYAGSLDELVEPIDVKKARVFANIDHMHLGEYSIIKQKTGSVDVLHPEEGMRTPSYWVLYDLQQILKTMPHKIAESQDLPEETQEAHEDASPCETEIEAEAEAEAVDKETVSTDVPSPSIPSTPVPSVSVPSVQVKSPSVPAVDVPSVQVPSAKTPSVQVPSTAVPSQSVPSVSSPR